MTDEKFSALWMEYDKKRRIAKRCLVTSKLVCWLGGFVFLCSSLFVSLGWLVQKQGVVLPAAVLERIPWFMGLWELLTHTVVEEQWTLRPEMLIAVAYLPAIVCSVLLCGLVWLLYHPLKRKQPQLTPAENGVKLVENAKQARRSVNRQGSNFAPLVCGVVYVMFVGVLVFFDQQQRDTAAEQWNIQLLVVVLAAYILLHGLFVLLTKWLYLCKFPYALVAAAEEYQVRAEKPMEEGQRRSYGAQLREGGLNMEREKKITQAKKLFWEAALCGDVPAMNHYARYCIIAHQRDPAVHWLERYLSTEKDVTAEKWLKRLKRGKWVSPKLLNRV